MWDYSEKVNEHFFNPRNAGALEERQRRRRRRLDHLRRRAAPDAQGRPGHRDHHRRAASRPSAAARPSRRRSALTEIIKGKTLDEALKVSNQDIADYLDGLPPEKMHCSVMGREALQAAVANYRGEVWSDDHEEGALVCKCFAIDAVLIEETVRANNLTTVEEVTNYTKAGGGCAACHEGIEEILTKVSNERCTAPTVAPKPAAPATADDGKPQADQLPAHPQDRGSRSRRSARTLQRDHGDIETRRGRRQEHLRQAAPAPAHGCLMEAATLGGIQQQAGRSAGRDWCTCCRSPRLPAPGRI